MEYSVVRCLAGGPAFRAFETWGQTERSPFFFVPYENLRPQPPRNSLFACWFRERAEGRKSTRPIYGRMGWLSPLDHKNWGTFRLSPGFLRFSRFSRFSQVFRFSGFQNKYQSICGRYD